MVFSSPIFLFGFLPIVLALYYLSPRPLKNPCLLLASLLFYAWGEVFYVLIMLVSIATNYGFGLLIGRSARRLPAAGVSLALGIGANLLLLGSFKYANFIVDNLNLVLSLVGLPGVLLGPVHLPLGISFFTFQAISYLADVYREETPAQKSLIDVALYISLFPQLVAGPIVRYHDVARQIVERRHTLTKFASGVERFVFGLAKKVLIANPLGEVADLVFGSEPGTITTAVAWLGLLCYTLQIYFDFSGYSDMAIGLGRMFGFRFLENFRYPYISRSVREFWRRWHISLSSWFRDYLYIPLGGSRVSPTRVHFNLVLVFVLCGFWHGASWNFLVWGLIHGCFLVLERSVLGRVLDRVVAPVAHLYTLLVVMLAWVFFRAETLPEALSYLSNLAGLSDVSVPDYTPAMLLSTEVAMALAAGLALSAPVFPAMAERLGKWARHSVGRALLVESSRLILLWTVLALTTVKIAASTYNPFIYFRF